MRTRTKVLITIGLAVLYFWASQRFDHKSAEHPMSDAVLQQFYADSNEDDFLGQLPKNTHVNFGDLSVINDMGMTYKRDDGSFQIVIDRKSNPVLRQAEMTELHEECHIATWKEEFDAHGIKFQQCMVDKAVHGAFHDLW